MLNIFNGLLKIYEEKNIIVLLNVYLRIYAYINMGNLLNL